MTIPSPGSTLPNECPECPPILPYALLAGTGDCDAGREDCCEEGDEEEADEGADWLWRAKGPCCCALLR